MPLALEVTPSYGQTCTKILQRSVPLLVREIARPDPLHAQGRLSPTLCPLSLAILYPHANAGASDIGQDFRTKLERHPRLYRQEAKLRPLYFYIRSLSHNSSSFGIQRCLRLLNLLSDGLGPRATGDIAQR